MAASGTKGVDHDEVEGVDSPKMFASFWWALPACGFWYEYRIRRHLVVSRRVLCWCGTKRFELAQGAVGEWMGDARILDTSHRLFVLLVADSWMDKERLSIGRLGLDILIWLGRYSVREGGVTGRSD